MDPTVDPKLAPDRQFEADRRLMGAVVDRQASAQRELVERLWPRIRITARYLSRDPVEADDLAQEAILEILSAAEGYRGKGRLEAWADVITARTIRHRLRLLRWTRWLTGTALSQVAEPRASAAVDPERQLLRTTRAGRLGELLVRLNKRQHLAIVLKTVYGYTVEEVADLMQERPETVRYLVRKARAKLRRLALRDPVLGDLLVEGNT